MVRQNSPHGDDVKPSPATSPSTAVTHLDWALTALDLVRNVLKAGGYADDSTALHNLGMAVASIKDARKAEATLSETRANDRCEKCPVVGCVYPRCGMDGQDVAEQLLAKYALDLLAMTNAAAFKIPLPNGMFVMGGKEADIKALPSARGAIQAVRDAQAGEPISEARAAVLLKEAVERADDKHSTPRTNAAAEMVLRGCVPSLDAAMEAVPAAFARQLERELAVEQQAVRALSALLEATPSAIGTPEEVKDAARFRWLAEELGNSRQKVGYLPACLWRVASPWDVREAIDEEMRGEYVNSERKP